MYTIERRIKMNEIKEYNEKVFEDIKHIDEKGNEYWLLRELMPLLEYTLWQNFHRKIKVAMENCINSNLLILDQIQK
jgi:DNA-damage-inducible protein